MYTCRLPNANSHQAADLQLAIFLCDFSPSLSYFTIEVNANFHLTATLLLSERKKADINRSLDGANHSRMHMNTLIEINGTTKNWVCKSDIVGLHVYTLQGQHLV